MLIFHKNGPGKRFVVWRVTRKLRSLPKPILLVTDFDGCLTDDFVWVNSLGEEFVKVTRKDGIGASLLQVKGIRVLILSTERNPVVQARAKKINVESIQNIKNKEAELVNFLVRENIDPKEVWTVGNDINDLGMFNVGVLALCPEDASEQIRRRANVVLPIKGGEGVLRFLAHAIL